MHSTASMLAKKKATPAAAASASSSSAAARPPPSLISAPLPLPMPEPADDDAADASEAALSSYAGGALDHDEAEGPDARLFAAAASSSSSSAAAAAAAAAATDDGFQARPSFSELDELEDEGFLGGGGGGPGGGESSMDDDLAAQEAMLAEEQAEREAEEMMRDLPPLERVTPLSPPPPTPAAPAASKPRPVVAAAAAAASISTPAAAAAASSSSFTYKGEFDDVDFEAADSSFLSAPPDPSAVAWATMAPPTDNPLYAHAVKMLQKYWGFSSFRPGQFQLVDAVVTQKRDAFVLMATGAGKSLCFQLLPLVSGKPCIVISPLISLMQDQVAALRQRGISACSLNSLEPNPQVARDAWAGKYQLIYISPERLAISISNIAALEASVGISAFAIDESHCLSEWQVESAQPLHRTPLSSHGLRWLTSLRASFLLFDRL